MIACGLSTLELRSIVEGAFLPLSCTCTIAPDRSMTIQITEPATGRVDLLVTGIDLRRLDSSRAINDLVAGLREDLDSVSRPQHLKRRA